MGRKKKITYENIEKADEISKQYIDEINNNIVFSLQVDPENKYNMPEEQKRFIAYYIQYRNVATAGMLANIDLHLATSYLMAYSTQQEIQRINKAIIQRQFATKLASLDNIGGWLTSLLTDDVVEGDKINSKEKIKVAQMIIDLHKLKAESLLSPQTLIQKDVNVELKDLSIETIKKLIYNDEQIEKKKEAIEKLKEEREMSYEDIEYLKTLDTETLLKFIEDLQEKKEEETNEEVRNDN